MGLLEERLHGRAPDASQVQRPAVDVHVHESLDKLRRDVLCAAQGIRERLIVVIQRELHAAMQVGGDLSERWLPVRLIEVSPNRVDAQRLRQTAM